MAKRSWPPGPPESGLFAPPKSKATRPPRKPRRWVGRTSSGETFTIEEERPRRTFWQRWGLLIVGTLFAAVLLLGVIAPGR